MKKTTIAILAGLVLGIAIAVSAEVVGTVFKVTVDDVTNVTGSTPSRTSYQLLWRAAAARQGIDVATLDTAAKRKQCAQAWLDAQIKALVLQYVQGTAHLAVNDQAQATASTIVTDPAQ